MQIKPDTAKVVITQGIFLRIMDRLGIKFFIGGHGLITK
jgi:hypothetical protein